MSERPRGPVRLGAADSAETPATVRRAVEFLETNAGREITLIEIAAAARLGPRALQTAFRAHFDSTPLEYLRGVRMVRAHADLQAADPTRGDTVGAVAARWMFAHAGRFSAEYRRTYGYSPAGTLRALAPAEHAGDRGRRGCGVRWALDPAERHVADADERCFAAAYARAAPASAAGAGRRGGGRERPDLGAALAALSIDPDDPADADDLDVVVTIWGRRALGAPVGPDAPAASREPTALPGPPPPS